MIVRGRSLGMGRKRAEVEGQAKWVSFLGYKNGSAEVS